MAGRTCCIMSFFMMIDGSVVVWSKMRNLGDRVGIFAKMNCCRAQMLMRWGGLLRFVADDALDLTKIVIRNGFVAITVWFKFGSLKQPANTFPIFRVLFKFRFKF